MRSLTIAACAALVVLVGFSTSSEAKFSPRVEAQLALLEERGFPLGNVLHAFATVTVEQFKLHPSLAEARRNVLNITIESVDGGKDPFAFICQFFNDDEEGWEAGPRISCWVQSFETKEERILQTVGDIGRWWRTDQVEMGEAKRDTASTDRVGVQFVWKKVEGHYQFFDYSRFVAFLTKKMVTNIAVSLKEMPVDVLRAYPFEVDVTLLKKGYY